MFTHLRQPVAQVLLTRSDIADVCKEQKLILELGIVDDCAAIAIHQCSEHIRGITEYGGYPNSQRERHAGRCCTLMNPITPVSLLSCTQEIKFGDNDTLSAITAAMVQADYLFLMTDVDGLYDKNPRTNPDARIIEVVEDIGMLAVDVSTAGSSLGTGGMSTKIVAARLATSAGVTTVITRASTPGNIYNIVNYAQSLKQGSSESLALPAHEAGAPLPAPMSSSGTLIKPPLHTRFLPGLEPIRDRSFWLLHGLAAHGTIFIDEGAHRALTRKAGLLPVGIVDVEGNFGQQEAVRLVVVARPCRSTSGASADGGMPISLTKGDTDKKTSLARVEVGRALVNYSSAEVARIKGLQSTEIHGVLGYADTEYVALRENVSLTKKEPSRPVTPSAANTNS